MANNWMDELVEKAMAVGPAPVEPSADQRAGAISIYQMFAAYLEAGFTRPEALQITMGLLLQTMKGSAE